MRIGPIDRNVRIIHGRNHQGGKLLQAEHFMKKMGMPVLYSPEKIGEIHLTFDPCSNVLVG